MNTIKIIKLKLVIFVFSTISLTAWSQPQAVEPGKINFTNFSINRVDKKIRIDWSTDKNIVTNYFELQKSTDGKNFKTIAMIMGPDPKAGDCDCYNCFDKPAANDNAILYYRVRHIDVDGNEQYSVAKQFK